MKNFITIFPYDKNLPAKPRINSPEVKSSRIADRKFEFDIQRLKIRMNSERKSLVNSPRSFTNSLEDLISKASEVRTNNLREFIPIARKDLSSKLKELKKLTKLDIDEYRELQAQRLRARRFIKADEREIRQLIKQDTLKHNFIIK
jgi:hypothetical protein